MWFVQAADPSGVLLNVCLSYRLTGDVDAARLHDALDAVARRHPVLRTTYAADENGEPQADRARRPAPGVGRARPVRDVRSAPAGCDSRCSRSVSSAAPFDLTADSPLRITLVRTGADEYVMLLVAHHIAWDDGSLAGVLRRPDPRLRRRRSRHRRRAPAGDAAADTEPRIWRTGVR